MRCSVPAPGPHIPWRAGRDDKPDGSYCPPNGRLPDATQVCHLLPSFAHPCTHTARACCAAVTCTCIYACFHLNPLLGQNAQLAPSPVAWLRCVPSSDPRHVCIECRARHTSVTCLAAWASTTRCALFSLALLLDALLLALVHTFRPAQPAQRAAHPVPESLRYPRRAHPFSNHTILRL